jgi:hypothetical protein
MRSGSYQLFAAFASLAFVIGHSGDAQTPAPSVSVGFGVDTTVKEVLEIVRLTRAYLAKPDSSARTRGLWSTKSQFDLRNGDLAPSAYLGFRATILGVSGTGPGDSLFVVKIVHAAADSSRKRITVLALQRIYAVRAEGSPYGWQLSSPVPRLTRNWARHTEGPITFVYEPGQKPSFSKARLAARFVDSVAKFFEVTAPVHLDAFVTASTDDAFRIIGIDFFPDGSGPGTGLGGRSISHGILLLGDPTVGESFLHEFVHAVLERKLQGSTGVFTEGIAEWVGGHHQYSAQDTFSMLRKYQLSHPTVTLAEALNGDAPGGEDGTTALYASSGLIIDSIYRRFGVAGIRRFAKVTGTPEDIIKVLPDYVSNWDSRGADAWWRSEAERALHRTHPFAGFFRKLN